MPLHTVLVDVMLKPEILDPAGSAVANALPSLGFAVPDSVRIGKHVEVRIEADSREDTEAQVRRMAETLLANPVIEDFTLRPV